MATKVKSVVPVGSIVTLKSTGWPGEHVVQEPYPAFPDMVHILIDGGSYVYDLRSVTVLKFGDE